jgi:hypothetical protein
MENGRPDFVLCICARRGPCALDTIPQQIPYHISYFILYFKLHYTNNVKQSHL